MSPMETYVCIEDKHQGWKNIRYCYHSLKSRCYDKNNKGYKNYGGRGITVCGEWRHHSRFLNFYYWAINNGYKKGLTLDRINNDGNYEPSNCRWVDKKEQGRNRRDCVMVTINGVTKTMIEWAEEYGIKWSTFRSRYRDYGWRGERLLGKPKYTTTKKRSRICVDL